MGAQATGLPKPWNHLISDTEVTRWPPPSYYGGVIRAVQEADCESADMGSNPIHHPKLCTQR